MTKVLVLGAAGDADKAAIIASSLVRAGFDASPVARLDSPHDSAACLVVCRSRNSAALLVEAAAAIESHASAGRAVYVQLDRSVESEPGAVDLSQWQGGTRHPGLAVVNDRVRAALSAKPGRRAWFAGGSALIVIIALYLGLVNDGLQLGGSALKALRSQETWVVAERRMQLFARGPLTPTHEAARAAAFQEAQSRAREHCADLAVAGEVIVEAATPQMVPWECARFSDRWRCHARGVAVCRVKERHPVD